MGYSHYIMVFKAGPRTKTVAIFHWCEAVIDEASSIFIVTVVFLFLKKKY